MKKLTLLLLAVLALNFSACSVITPTPDTTPGAVATSTHDAIVINSEKTLRVSKDTFDLFLRLEDDNRAEFALVSPEIHKFANKLRREAPGWLKQANKFKNIYKHSGPTADPTTLQNSLVVLSDATTKAQQYINQANKP